MKNVFVIFFVILAACSSSKGRRDSSSVIITEADIRIVIESIKADFPAAAGTLLEKGVKHAASLWRSKDGSGADFADFVKQNYIPDPVKRKAVFSKISGYFESLSGNFNEITLDLRKTLDLSKGEIDDIDRMFGNYSAGSHVLEDFYSNKIAFAVALNFPYFTLAEKEALGPEWSGEDWAMARLGDIFVSRVPAEIDQAVVAATGNAGMYIAEYNIHMGNLRTEDGRRIFPEGMVLLSHWNLRDELKANYADKSNGGEKQEMIYRVMERIIRQEIPEVVINSPDYEWAPFSNKVTRSHEEVETISEPDTRYSHVISIFKALKALDPYNPEMNSAILRRFSVEMEIAQEEVEAMFKSYLGSPQLIELGKLISERLGRELRPYDIWYDGFKTRSTVAEDFLTSKTSALYPDPESFKKAMPSLLRKLGWPAERANYIADKIVVDPARGSGHAWGAAMKGSVSHLRTRISDDGMDYKGYNIAIHEFGHNVEQTISLYDIENYMMSGVPNTGFTEALAFMFQSRDLMLLDVSEDQGNKERMQTLDRAWSLMEIMGVGMVEMKVWKWLYENTEATPGQLKAQFISSAVEVWNDYFGPVMGVQDSPILAIYSHMIEVPLYLPNYAYGQIIESQIEEYLKGKDFAGETDRMFRQGKLTPQQWMEGAVGKKISPQPVIDALNAALKSPLP
ncbi:MAG: hypothetical protein K0B05_04825 [Bacteroidales bacterium]|nr:hypothetical protein [Bacteroidales bacterium]